jgi:hypothetical protein
MLDNPFIGVYNCILSDCVYSGNFVVVSKDWH